MSEKSKVKSFIRKGKIVKGFDRKKKDRKTKLILGSIAAIGVIGGSALLLKKTSQNPATRSSIITSNRNPLTNNLSTPQPQISTIQTINVIPSRSKILNRPKTSIPTRWQPKHIKGLQQMNVLYEGIAQLNKSLYFPTGKALPLSANPTKKEILRRLKEERERQIKNMTPIKNMIPLKSRKTK